MFALALVVAAAAASLFGPEPVQRLAGSAWFLAGAGTVALAGLVAAATAIARRSWPGAVQHLGLVIALAGVTINQRAAHSGYLFVEQAAGPTNVCLSRDLRRIEELPVPVALDSVGSLAARGFRPAPVAWVTGSTGSGSRPVTFNRPLVSAGRQLLFSRIVAPGFLREYVLAANGEEYLLMHNQAVELSPGLRVWSFAYDGDERKVGLMLGGEQQWLSTGDSVTAQGQSLRLTETTFAPNVGAIFIVNDVRYRFIIFAGFGLMLLGLLPPLLRNPGTGIHRQGAKTPSGSGIEKA